MSDPNNPNPNPAPASSGDLVARVAQLEQDNAKLAQALTDTNGNLTKLAAVVTNITASGPGQAPHPLVDYIFSKWFPNEVSEFNAERAKADAPSAQPNV